MSCALKSVTLKNMKNGDRAPRNLHISTDYQSVVNYAVRPLCLHGHTVPAG